MITKIIKIEVTADSMNDIEAFLDDAITDIPDGVREAKVIEIV